LYFYLLSIWLPAFFTHFRQRSHYRWSTVWSSPPCYFSYPHLRSYRRPPEREWGRPAHSSPPATSQTVRTLSQTVKESRPPSLWPPHMSWIAPSLSSIHPPGRLLWELCRSHESNVNHSGRHIKGLSKFPDIISPVILQFGGHIGDGILCVEISLIGRGRRFLYFTFDKRLYLHCRQGLVMVETF
jgi:hypothetical protein